MNISHLVPEPIRREAFRRSRQRFVPARSGCYVLTTFDGIVLYVGLTTSLRQRMGEHLDDPAKIQETKLGRAIWFYWIESAALEVQKIERTWMNIHTIHEGALPLLNRAYSPVSI
jgi:GIY-YIG catalytic domain